MEIFKQIEGFTGYLIYNDGRIFSTKSNKFLKQFPGSSDYMQVGLSKKGRVKIVMVHREVAKAFLPNPENKPQVNHKNGKKHDNSVSNLEWVTKSENALHSIRVLGNPPPPNWAKGQFGKNHNRSKEIFEFDLKGNLLETYESGPDFQRKTGKNFSSPSWAIKNRRPIFNKLYSFSENLHFEL